LKPEAFDADAHAPTSVAAHASATSIAAEP